MEDTKVFQDNYGEDKNKCYFGLFDGYHGRFAADMAAAELHHLLLNEMAKFDPKTKSTTVTNILDNTNVEQVNLIVLAMLNINQKNGYQVVCQR